MRLLEKRRKTALILSLSAGAVALFSAVGAVLLALSGNYAPAVICALLCIFSSYCVPIYYKSMVSSKMAIIIFSSVDSGLTLIDDICEETGIKKDVALRLIENAIKSKSAMGYTFDGNKIIKNENA